MRLPLRVPLRPSLSHVLLIVHSHRLFRRQHHRPVHVLAEISRLQIEHVEGAHLEWNANKAHRRPVDVDHVLVKGLDVVIVDRNAAGRVQEGKIVLVAGAEQDRVETTTRAVHKLDLVVVVDATNVGLDGHVGRVLGGDGLLQPVTEYHLRRS